MKKIIGISGICVAMVVSITMCKKPYNPTIAATDTNVLVVEGVINSGGDSTFIKLTRTIKLTDKSVPKAELKAVVNVEDDQSGNYPLKELTNGSYASAGLNLNSARKYRLRIKTTDGAVYLSDFESVKITPPIDSIGYTANADGINIYANAHDASNNTQYYRWEYEDAWRFHTTFDSGYITDSKDIVDRKINQRIYYCYTNSASTIILLGSSAKLTQDVIFQAPLLSIPGSSEKLMIRYSILVRQYALTKQAYAFYENVKKNTETLGSIFDAQPSAPVGNIHCISNPDLPVIGYASVSTVQSKRIFIDKSELPPYVTQSPYSCSLDTVWFSNPVTRENDVKNLLVPPGSSSLPVYQASKNGIVIGYMASRTPCVDCTIRGKVTPPPFWK